MTVKVEGCNAQHDKYRVWDTGDRVCGGSSRSRTGMVVWQTAFHPPGTEPQDSRVDGLATVDDPDAVLVLETQAGQKQA